MSVSATKRQANDEPSSAAQLVCWVPRGGLGPPDGSLSPAAAGGNLCAGACRVVAPTAVPPPPHTGWLHPATRAILHDYTLYSSTKDAYVTVRLVIEIGLDHGLFIPTKHVRMLMLTDWPEQSVVVEFIFYGASSVRRLDQILGSGN
eukprot:COSAG01_NODE_5194_length_4419_cov_6.478752_5_plen_147_part_00